MFTFLVNQFFYLIFAMIPALLLGYSLLFFFPNTSWFVLVVLNLSTIIWAFYKLRKMHREDWEASDKSGEKPKIGYLKRVWFFVVLGTIIGSNAIFSATKIPLYIDNASDKKVRIDIPYHGLVTVKAHSYEVLRVAKSKIEVAYNGKKKNLDMTTNGQWVLNIDGLNKYIRTDIKYSNEAQLLKHSGGELSPLEKAKYEIIEDEFFNADVDFVFDAPSEIENESLLPFGTVQKTILYRMDNEDIIPKTGKLSF
jgi:hypothetical protein